MDGSKQWKRIQLRKLEGDKAKKTRSSEGPESWKLESCKREWQKCCFRIVNENNAIGAES